MPMLLTEKQVLSFLDGHLSPASFDIEFGELYRKEIERKKGNRTKISFLPDLSVEEREAREGMTDTFKGHDDEFPVRYYARDIEIADLRFIGYESLSGNTRLQFQRLNKTKFKLQVQELSLNSFKEIIRYAESKAEIAALLSFLDHQI